jgi:hypothetical protein
MRLIAFSKPCFQDTEKPVIRRPIQLDRYPGRQELGGMMREVAAMVPEAWDGRGSNLSSLSNLSMMVDEGRRGSTPGPPERYRISPRSGRQRHGGTADGRHDRLADWGIGGLANGRIGRPLGRVGGRDSGPHLPAAFCASNHLVWRLIPYESRRLMRPMRTEHEHEP